MTSDPQNIYDDSRFFAGYTGLDRFLHPFGWAMEHRRFMEMVGDVGGRRVLDLGCGGGQLAHALAIAGAASVIATDVSARMLEVARTRWAHPAVTLKQVSMEDARFEAAGFDLVVSSLAFHYVEDYEGLLSRIASWLVPGGRLVFSTEHPIYASRSTDEGWTSAGWAIDDYAVEGLRTREWFVPGVVRYHRTIATLLNGLIGARFAIERVWESAPDEAWLKARPGDAQEKRRPMFLLVQAVKSA